MKKLMSNERYSFVKYNSEIIELGPLRDNEQKNSDEYVGTYSYIVIQDLDEDKVVQLKNVDVYLSAGPYIKVGERVELVLVHAGNDDIYSSLMAVIKNQQIVSNEYGQFLYAVNYVFNQSLKDGKRYRNIGFLALAATPFTALFIIPLFIFPPLALLMFYLAHRHNKGVKLQRKQQLTVEQFNDLVATSQ